MPYLSDSQRRWAHTDAGTKALGGASKVAEWDEASARKKLPEHVKPHVRHYSRAHKAMMERRHSD